MGNLLGEPFKKYVSEQISIRQKIHGKTINRTINDIKYLNSRNAWVKLASGVSLDQKRFDLLKGNPMIEGVKLGQDLAVKNVLFNGLASFGSSTLEDPDDITSKDTFYYNLQQRSGITGTNKVYGVGGKDFGYSPMPGIIDVDVKDLNRGSIKKATVNIKCHNRNQLDIIDVLYMRLGYTVFLEWGYDKYIDNKGNFQNMSTTLIEDTFFQQEFSKSDYSVFLPLIENRRKETFGNYSALFGTVSNFSWSFETDGSYSVKIEIITLGDIIESLKINLPSPLIEGSSLRNRDLERLKERGGVLSENEFYSTLYPNLSKVLEDYYKAYTNKSNQTLTKVAQPVSGESFNGSLVFEDNPRGLQFDFSSILKENYDNVISGFRNIHYFRDMIANFFIPLNFQERYKNQYLIVRGNTNKLQLVNFSNPENFLPEYPSPMKNLDSQDNFIVLNEDIRGFLYTYSTFILYKSRKSPIPGGRAGWADLAKKEGNNSTMLDNNIGNTPRFPVSLLQQNIIFFLFTLNDFKTQVYKDFVSKGLATIGEENTQTIPPEENNIKGKFKSFSEIGKKKKNKNIIFEYFWNIRFLFDGKYEEKEIEYKLFSDNIVEGEVEFEGLDNQPKITTYDKEIGYQLNPGKNQDSNYWDNKIIFPKYNINSENLPASTNQLGCDFVKLTVFPIEDSYFIRLGTFLEFLQQKVIPKIEKTETPLIKIDTDSTNNICYVIDNTISLDLTKCIINNNNFYTALETEKNGFTSIFQGLEPYIFSDGNARWAQIMNIYLNFSRVEAIMENVDTNNEISLFNILKTICNDINESLGNINNLEPIIDKETNTVKIIDQTPIPGINQISSKLSDEYSKYNTLYVDQPELGVFGYDFQKGNEATSNFVHNISLTTEISKEYASMITIGATANGSIPGVEATAFSTWNNGIFDRFKNNITNPSTVTTGSLKTQNESVLKKYADFIGDEYGTLGLNQNKGTDTVKSKSLMLIINNDFISVNKDIASNYYIYAQSEITKENLKNSINSTESSVGFLPFNLKIDMDGISGIKIYNRLKVNTNFLPSNYGPVLDFIITGVNHKLSNNSWTTSLTTLATSKSVLT